MTTLNYRKDRITLACEKWSMEQVNNLFARKQIPSNLYNDLQESIMRYIARALHFEFIRDESQFLSRMEAARSNRKNVTPNGGVVPKKEFALEYNFFIRSWCEIMRGLTKDNPSFLKRFRLTPNIRIKFAEELEENIGRGLDTALPHSDAWVEGPWGMNCHLPILGDTENNYLHFYKLKDESQFSDDFLATSPDYKAMQWVMKYYEDDSNKPQRGFVNLSDYALIHKTQRNQGAGSRISIDTTVFIGDHDVHPDREVEYMNEIPRIGSDLYIACEISENDDVKEKKTAFSHYTSGNLRRVGLT